MSRVWNKTEKLWSRVEEVEDLWYEEEKQSFAEMSKDSNNCKDHSREIAIRVPNKHLRWVPVMPPQRQ